MKISSLFIVSFVILWVTPATANEIVSPAWSSDDILKNRIQNNDAAIVIGFTSKISSESKPNVIKSGIVRLWSDFDQISIGTQETVTDYQFCRVYSWKHSETTFSNHSCYAEPAFRKIELHNQLKISTLLNKAGASVEGSKLSEEAFWLEQEFATQNVVSNPLSFVNSKEGIEWRLGNTTIAKISSGGFTFFKKDRQKFSRYFSRYLNIHPQIRRTILESGEFPSRIEILRRNFDGESIETITFSSLQNAKIKFPLPPKLISETIVRSAGESIEAKGLRQAINASEGNIVPPKSSFDELLNRLEETATKKESLETTLTFLALTQLYGAEIFTDQEKLGRLRRIMPIVRPLLTIGEAAKLWQASGLAGKRGDEPEREIAAQYLANAQHLDQMDFGTFRYVTFANLVRISKDTKNWDKEIFEKMPSLTDGYWKHIIAYPWSSNTYKDLGDTWYSQFETFRAWEVWDLGKTIDPDWESGTMKSIAEYEQKIRSLMPDNF